LLLTDHLFMLWDLYSGSSWFKPRSDYLSWHILVLSLSTSTRMLGQYLRTTAIILHSPCACVCMCVCLCVVQRWVYQVDFLAHNVPVLAGRSWETLNTNYHTVHT